MTLYNGFIYLLLNVVDGCIYILSYVGDEGGLKHLDFVLRGDTIDPNTVAIGWSEDVQELIQSSVSYDINPLWIEDRLDEILPVPVKVETDSTGKQHVSVL